MRPSLPVLIALTVPQVAGAQAYRCAVPAGAHTVRPDLPGLTQPRRVVPIGGYTLALTWAPQYCRDSGRRVGARFQCASGNRFGFTLHGLWPDGVGRAWPQYCRPAGLVPQPVIATTLCATPSAQLIQHEWAKHGTCMGAVSPAGYFREAKGLYARLRYPDMDALSRRPALTAGKLAQAMAEANPGLRAEMMRITATRSGWLNEIWLCLDRRRTPARCPAHQGGLAPRAAVKVWRGGR